MNAAKLPAASDPIAELIRFYDRLSDDPNRQISGFGFSPEGIQGCLVIDLDGTNPSLEDIQGRSDKGKPYPKSMIVPSSGGRSGTSIQPNFLWDNTGYVLGIDAKGKPDRASKMQTAFLELHQDIADEVEDCEEINAIVKFLQKWNSEDASKLDHWEELIGKNLVFQIRGQTRFVHEIETLRKYWSDKQRRSADDPSGAVIGPSLFDGETKNLARLHPLVQGVVGANSTGAALVSFNKDAFASYGKEQSYNSPLGIYEAFKYTTALQSLLSDPSRRFRVGDTTAVFWTDSKSDVESELAVQLFSDVPPPRKPTAEHSTLVDRLRAFVRDASAGLVTDRIEDPRASFYILGLSPSTSRLSVRFWMTGSIHELGQRLQQHLDDVSIVGLDDDRIPMVRSMLYQSVRDAKEVSPKLAGETMRSVLTGTVYPQPLLTAIVRRCRINRGVSTMQAAILKACLTRSDRIHGSHPAIEFELTPSHPSIGYQLGRLLAVLDLSHLGATDGRVKPSTAASRLSLAATNPVMVFPELLRLHQHHCGKLPTTDADAKRRKTRTRKTFEAMRNEVFRNVTHFPSSLSFEEQARFLVGFYQQTQFYFTPVKVTGATTPGTEK